MIEKVDVDGDGSVNSLLTENSTELELFRNIDFKEFKKMMAD